MDRYIHVQRGTKLGEKGEVIMIGVDKETDRSYFSRFELDESGRVARSAVAPNCTSCHHSNGFPMLQKVPGVQSFSLSSEPTAVAEKEINSHIAQSLNATPVGRNKNTAPNYGGFTTSQTNLDSCIVIDGKPLPKESLNKIRASMNCYQCHGTSFGAMAPIRWPFDEYIMSQIILTGHMPPHPMGKPGMNNILRKEERRALLQCLNERYFGPQGALTKYLNPSACDALAQSTK